MIGCRAASAFGRSAAPSVNETSVFPVFEMFWTIMSMMIPASLMVWKIFAATPGLSGHPRCDLRLGALEADPADDDGLHAGVLFSHDGSWVVVHAAADFEGDAELFCELHRPGLHHLTPRARHFQHFVVGDLVDLPALGTTRGSQV